jgi:5-methylcytosine-specific restriction endonuclease McrA
MSRANFSRPEAIRAELRKRDGDNCWLCAGPIDFTLPPGTFMGPSIEHVKPRAAGGADDWDNLRLTHAYPCNSGKGGKWDYADYGRTVGRAHRLRTAPKRKAWPVDTTFESWSASQPH